MAEWTTREREDENECIDRDRTVCFRSEVNAARSTEHHTCMKFGSTDEKMNEQISSDNSFVRFAADEQLVSRMIIFQNGEIMNIDHDVFVRRVFSNNESHI